MTSLHCGDCLEVMRRMPDNIFDTIITDPPYALTSKHGARSPQYGEGGKKNAGERVGGFMGMRWDAEIPGPEVWAEVLRVAKPGASLVAFGGTRTFHRLMVALEDAGWGLRDTLCWLYGQGMPKSHNISKAVDRRLGAERPVIGTQRLTGNACVPTKAKGGTYGVGVGTVPPKDVPITGPGSPEAAAWEGWGTGLSPSWEPIVWAMAPREGTFVDNAFQWKVAGIHVDGCRNGDEALIVRRANPGGDALTFRNGSRAGMGYLSREARGRWPTNVLLDDATAEVLDRQADNVARYFSNPEREARFLYCPKAHRKEKDAGLEDFEPRPTASMQGNLVDGQRLAGNGTPIRTPHGRNTHKTVKPVALMEWLCRLTETPSGGRVLDPFMGSGTTGIACVRTGRQFVGIEQSGEYVAIAWARIRHAEREANATRQLTLMGGQAAG